MLCLSNQLYIYEFVGKCKHICKSCHAVKCTLHFTHVRGHLRGDEFVDFARNVKVIEGCLLLEDGDSGLEIYLRLISAAERAVREGGALLLELGYRSLDAVRERSCRARYMHILQI